jgi:hypothetical protein
LHLLVVRVTTDPVFFDASSAHTPEEQRYLNRLDALLPAALDGGVDPTEVGCVWYGGVLTWLTVPDVPLGAYWGCSHLWDDFSATQSTCT